MNGPALSVHHACTYPSSQFLPHGDHWLQSTWNALKFVKAIKGDEIRGFAYVPVPIGGQARRLEEANKDNALRWFAEMVSSKWNMKPLRILVPVPGHLGDSAAVVRASRQWRLAAELATLCPAATASALVHWTKPIESARSGGERDPRRLRERVAEIAPPSSTAPVLLIDDVVTSGGHIIACAWALMDAGYKVEAAMCVAQTVDVERELQFVWEKRTLDLSR